MLSKHVVLNQYPHFLIWRSTWIQWQTCLCDVSTSPFHLSAHLSSLIKTFSMLILVSISRLIFWVICFLYLIYLCTCKVWLPVCLSVCLLACLSVIFASLSVCLSGCLPACLSVCFVCLSVCLCLCLCLCLTVCLSVCLSVCLFSSIFVCLCLSVFLFVLDSFCHSVCLSVSLFVCLFAWLAAWLFVFVFVFYLPVCFAACLSVCLASQLSAGCLSVFLPRCLCCQCALSGVLNSRSRARVPQEKRTPAQVRMLIFVGCTGWIQWERLASVRTITWLALQARENLRSAFLALWNPLAGQKEVRSTFQTMQLMTRIKFEFNSCLKVKWRTDTLELNSNWILLYIRFQAFFESEFHAHL